VAKKINQPHGGAINRLEKGETANPNGRPHKTLAARVISDLKKEGYDNAKHGHVIEAFEILINLDEDRIKEIVADKKYPMVFRLSGKALLGSKGFDVMKDLLDRAHGKPKQTTDITSGGDKLPFTGYEIIKALGADQQDGTGKKQEGRPKDE
jgi:hypothetical protein